VSRHEINVDGHECRTCTIPQLNKKAPKDVCVFIQGLYNTSCRLLLRTWRRQFSKLSVVNFSERRLLSQLTAATKLGA